MDNLAHIEPCVIFLTGLSGAGKTTIANKLAQELKSTGIIPIVLDGDEIRKAIHISGFDEEARKKHNLGVGSLAALFEAQGHIVIVALIAPYEETRNQIRSICRNFTEVYLATDINVCIERDTKGLYKKAISGEIKDFTGISAPYHPPKNPELVLDTAVLSIDTCTKKIMGQLKKNDGHL